jgi:hypothetical protein
MANGAALTLSVRNAPRVSRELRSFRNDVVAEIRALVGETAARQHQRTYDLCPKDTYRMANAIRVNFAPDGLSYEMGWYEGDFVGRGLAFYPLFQELGFRHAGSGRFIQNASLRPAWREIQPEFNRQLRAVIRRAANRRGGR